MNGKSLKSRWEDWREDNVSPFCTCHRISIFEDYTCKYHRWITKALYYWKYLTNSHFRKQCKIENTLATMLGHGIQDEINREIIREIYRIKKDNDAGAR